MSDRELLEKRAAELGVEHAADMPDAELLELTELARRMKLEERATALGVKFPANIGDEKLAEKIAAAEAKADPKTPDAPDQGNASTDIQTSGEVDATPPGEGTVKVVVAIAGGRRRAGRRWAGGETTVAMDELSEGAISELEADPLFMVFQAD